MPRETLRQIAELAPRIRLLAIVAAVAIAMIGLFLLFAHGGRNVAAEAPPSSAPELPPPATEPDDAEVALPVLPKPAPKDKERARFDRADRNSDGGISQAEFLYQSRKNFDRRDLNHDGVLSFEEYAQARIEKFHKTDANRNGALDRAEFATTAAKPRQSKQPECSCD